MKKNNPSAMSPRSSEPNGFDPNMIWIAIRRCWPWAIPSGVLLAGAAAFFVINTFVPSYRATHILGVNQVTAIKGLGLLSAPRELARTEGLIVKNDVVTRAVLSDPECASYSGFLSPEQAEKVLVDNIKVSAAGSNDRMMLTFTGTDPMKVKLICNRLAESYLRYREISDNRSVALVKEWLEPEIARREKEVKAKRRKVLELGKGSPFAQGDSLSRWVNSGRMDHINSLKSQLVKMEQEVEVSQAELKAFEDGKLVPDPEPTRDFVEPSAELLEIQIQAMVRNDPDVARERTRLEQYRTAAIEMEDRRLDLYREVLQKEKDSSRRLVVLEQRARKKAIRRQEELRKLEDDARQVAAVEREKAREFINKAKADTILAEKRRQHELLESNLAILKRKFQEEFESLKRNGGENVELRFAEHEFDIANEILDGLKAHIGLARADRQSAVITIAPATTPKTPIEDLPYKKLVMVCFGAMAIPLALGVLWEFRSKRLTNAAMCDRNGLQVIGEVACLPAGPNSAKGKRIFEESIDALRSNLFLSLETETTRTISIVSSMSGEGKSCVSSQIALSIAKATGHTVLLVDCDLRCPDQHEIFGLNSGPGVSAVLAGDVCFEDAVDKSLGELIHLMPAGRLSMNPHRLINRESMKAFVDEALKHYQYVVIDTAPILSAGESLAVATATDTTLLCVMRDISQVDHVARASCRLQAAGVSIAGTVFSGISTRGYAYRYGDYDYDSSSLVNIQSNAS